MIQSFFLPVKTCGHESDHHHRRRCHDTTADTTFIDPVCLIIVEVQSTAHCLLTMNTVGAPDKPTFISADEVRQHLWHIMNNYYWTWLNDTRGLLCIHWNIEIGWRQFMKHNIDFIIPVMGSTWDYLGSSPELTFDDTQIYLARGMIRRRFILLRRAAVGHWCHEQLTMCCAFIFHAQIQVPLHVDQFRRFDLF